MRLDTFSRGNYSIGRNILIQVIWFLIGQPLLSTRLIPLYAFKRVVLRLFGAQIANGVVVKPGVRVKFPWRLSVGAHSWIGEDVWIDNLDKVSIGEHVCVSQGVYICTGSHDWTSSRFDLITKPVRIESHAWIGAQCSLAPNTHVLEGAVVTLGSVARGTLSPWSIYSGNPATLTGVRRMTSAPVKPSVMFVNQAFWPDCSASAQFVTDAAVHVAARGNDVHVVTMRNSYVSDSSFSCSETYQGVRITRSVTPPLYKPKTKIGRIIYSAMSNCSLLITALRSPRCEVMIALTSPPLLGVFLRFVAALRGARYVAWVFDLNPDQAVAAGWIGKESLLHRMLDRVVANSFEAASAIVVLDEYMADRIKEKVVSLKNIHALSLWASAAEIHPIAHADNTFRQNTFEGEPFILLFAGNLSICHPVRTILEAAKLLRDDPTFVFVFSGGGPRVEEVVEFAALHELVNIHILPYRSREELPELLAAGDLHLVPMGDDFVGIVHPSKVYGIVATGRPFVFIGPERSFIVDQFVRNGIGAHVNHGDVDKLVALIRQEQQRSISSRSTAQMASRTLAERFERTTVLESLCKVLNL